MSLSPKHLKRRFAESLARFLVSKPRLRFAFIDELRKSHWADLGFRIRVEKDLHATLCFPDSIESFREVFVEREYEWVDAIPFPCSRWLDFGCNNGYFSLYLTALNQKANPATKVEALLVDGDARSGRAVGALREANPKMAGIQFREAVVGPATPSVTFAIIPGMRAHVGEDVAAVAHRTVPVLSQAEVMKLLPPPYDLVKADIEGSEIDFLENYPLILRETKRLIVEWHSWNQRGASLEEFRQQLKKVGFTTVEQPHPLIEFVMDGKPVSCTVLHCAKS